MRTDYKARYTQWNTKPPKFNRKWLGVGFVITLMGVTLIWFATTKSPFIEPIDAEVISYQVSDLSIPDAQLTKLSTDTEDSSTLKYAMSKIKIKPGDNLNKIFQKLDISMSELHRLKSDTALARNLTNLKPGQEFEISINQDKQVEALRFSPSAEKQVLVTRTAKAGFKERIHTKEIETRLSVKEATIRNSLYFDGRKAGIDDKMLHKVMELFAWDIDFAHDLQPKDKLKILLEEKFVDGKKVGEGPILIAEFINGGKSYKAIYYENEKNGGGYYTKNGNSLKKAFLRTPVQFSRISSKFNLARHHPILHTLRAHRGVDYAAPTGTPVRASGDGQIIHKGPKGGYGNTIILLHGTRYSTLYGHLNHFAHHLKMGQKVKQGQVIGYVGSTGLASGPHLHYEFRIDGEHRDPLTVALPRGNELPKHKVSDFFAKVKSLSTLLDKHAAVTVASNQKEI